MKAFTTIYDDVDEPIIGILKESEGGLLEWGIQLASFLEGRLIFTQPYTKTAGPYALGMNCLAAQIVSEFKETPGGLFLYSPDAEESEDESFEVHFAEEGSETRIAYHGSFSFSMGATAARQTLSNLINCPDDED